MKQIKTKYKLSEMTLGFKAGRFLLGIPNAKGNDFARAVDVTEQVASVLIGAVKDVPMVMTDGTDFYSLTLTKASTEDVAQAFGLSPTQVMEMRAVMDEATPHPAAPAEPSEPAKQTAEERAKQWL